MKKSLLIALAMMISVGNLFSQTPQAFKYQAVARDLNGNPLINSEISVKISILAGSPEGEVVYSELHQTTTNSMGLFGLEIGNPTQVLSGSFAEIDWGGSSHFLETAVDHSGGGQFQVLGVTQFLTVPYAKYSDNSGFSTIANGIQTMTEQDRDALQNPPAGMQIYNSTSNCLNYFSGAAWFETCGHCTPLPSQAEAGEDQHFADATLTTNLQGNIPVYGTGTWTIESGNGGSFANANDPQTLFTGQQCESYSLIWTITSPCGSTSDTVSVTFFITPTPANAGEDQTITQITWTTLAANTPLIGQGQWTIIQGNGGQLVTPNSPNSLFLGQTNSLYILRWKISGACSNSNDSVQISFCAGQPTIAYAGPDQLNITGTSTTLQGSVPVYGIGHWSIVSGTGCNIVNPENPTSTFTGQIGVTYELKWTISNACGSNHDNVTIGFSSLAIGVAYQGGIIAYIFQLGDPGYVVGEVHGLISAPSGQSASAQWGCNGNVISGADGTALGTGKQNTIDIEADCTATGIAADICANLTLGGYGDWFLPSKDELNILYINKALIGGFASDWYWSSSEYSNYFAGGQRFSDGSISALNKEFPHYVRAIRAF